MRNSAPTCLSIALPSALCGLPLALCAAWTGGGLAAALAAGASVAAGLGAAVAAGRAQRAATDLLRRPELRGGSRPAGLFGPVVHAALERLGQCERDAAQASAAKSEVEARANVRRRQIRQFEMALDAVEHPVLLTDVRDQWQFGNDAAWRLLRGQPRPAARPAVGEPAPDLAALPGLKALVEETRTRSAATSSRTAEVECQQGGEAAAYRATATIVRDEDGALLGVVTVLHDIRVERRERTRHAEFVSSVCHELKTPMASIRAFTEMLIDGDVETEEERRETYGFIETQVDRLTRLVNNMLNLARIESGVIKVQREDCELNDVLAKSVDVVRQLASEKRITLTPELSDLYLAAHVDRDLFGQAVINLLSNAVKYTPEGGEVRLRSRMEDGWGVIEVRDNGMGIPADSLPKLFQRFYRVPENSKAAAGTGLGLALVKYIITELHGGRIGVESEVNQGTCFTVTVPLGHRGSGRRRPEPALAGA